jgi:hypothetical protein
MLLYKVCDHGGRLTGSARGRRLSVATLDLQLSRRYNLLVGEDNVPKMDDEFVDRYGLTCLLAEIRPSKIASSLR